MVNNTDHIVPDFLLNPQKRIYRHLLLQLVVFLITINVFWDTPDELIITPPRIRSWIGYFLIINMLIYVNAYILVPRFLLKGRLLLYLITASGLILISIVILGTLQTLFEDTRFESLPTSQSVILLNILSSTISSGLLVAGSSAMILFKHWISNNLRVNELEAATLQSELKFLKSQINPHFLFNMLNNANVLIRESPIEAVHVLSKLKDLLKYQLKDSTSEKVFLADDIHFLNDYLNLEKIRRDNFDFIISAEGEIADITVPPLLFIPFVENAVKHNNDNEKLSYVHLYFKVEEAALIFICLNSKPAEQKEKAADGGIGLANIRRRLQLLYDTDCSLEIDETDITYTINLRLKLK